MVVTNMTEHMRVRPGGLDAGVPLRDVQEAASHVDPRTTMRYENSRELRQTGEKLQVT